MKKHSSRRSFIALGGATVAALAGYIGENGENGRNGADNGEEGFPSHDLPRHSEWVATETHDGDVFFTHLDWAVLDDLDSEGGEDEEDTEDVIEEIPILGLPLYGGLISPLAVFGIAFYPFSGDVLPENGQTAEGVGTETMTWAGEALVFQGEYDPAVFADQYADGFEETDGREGFTLYVGDDEFTEGMAYAVSEETLVVGMMPGDDDEYVPENIVSDALERYGDSTGRVVDEDDGQWLFETTGEARMAFGAWQTDDLMAALAPDEGGDEDVDNGPDAEPDVEDNPVFDAVESLVNNIVFTVEDGEMHDIEARFSGIYPDEAVPSEDEVREHLIGVEDVPHEIVIDGNRVHATATFEEL